MIYFESKEQAEKVKEEFLRSTVGLYNNMCLLGNINYMDYTQKIVKLDEGITYNVDTKQVILHYKDRASMPTKFYIPDWIELRAVYYPYVGRMLLTPGNYDNKDVLSLKSTNIDITNETIEMAVDSWSFSWVVMDVTDANIKVRLLQSKDAPPCFFTKFSDYKNFVHGSPHNIERYKGKRFKKVEDKVESNIFEDLQRLCGLPYYEGRINGAKRIIIESPFYYLYSFVKEISEFIVTNAVALHGFKNTTDVTFRIYRDVATDKYVQSILKTLNNNTHSWLNDLGSEFKEKDLADFLDNLKSYPYGISTRRNPNGGYHVNILNTFSFRLELAN